MTYYYEHFICPMADVAQKLNGLLGKIIRLETETHEANYIIKVEDFHVVGSRELRTGIKVSIVAKCELRFPLEIQLYK